MALEEREGYLATLDEATLELLATDMLRAAGCSAEARDLVPTRRADRYDLTYADTYQGMAAAQSAEELLLQAEELRATTAARTRRLKARINDDIELTEEIGSGGVVRQKKVYHKTHD